MIWTVSVSGNENISDEQILNVFSSLGVKPGAKRRDINAKEISDEALKIFDGDLSFAVVNLNGSNASVEVRESVPAPKIEDNETPCNIVCVGGRRSDKGTVVFRARGNKVRLCRAEGQSSHIRGKDKSRQDRISRTCGRQRVCGSRKKHFFRF